MWVNLWILFVVDALHLFCDFEFLLKLVTKQSCSRIKINKWIIGIPTKSRKIYLTAIQRRFGWVNIITIEKQNDIELCKVTSMYREESVTVNSMVKIIWNTNNNGTTTTNEWI